MSAIEVATPCFYRLRGSMKLRFSSSEVHAPLECKSTSGSETTEECTLCKRSYHPQCDHLTRNKYLSSTLSGDFVEPPDDDSQSEPPHGCDIACPLTPNVGKQICFPCQYHEQIELAIPADHTDVKLCIRPPKGVHFTIRAFWDVECRTIFIQLRGIELREEFDVSKGKHIDVGWRKVRNALHEKLGKNAPWFVGGGGLFTEFCVRHGVYEDRYLEEVFRIKGAEKWKYLQDVYKEKARGTISTLDEDGNIVRKRANCTGEQQLDLIEWPYFLVMQQAMLHRPSVCPPRGIVLQTSHNQVKCALYTQATVEDDNPHPNAQDVQHSDGECPPHIANDKENPKRSKRPDEAGSPANLQKSKGRRPSHATQRHDDILAVLKEHTQVSNNNLKQAINSITEMQKELQTKDMDNQILDRAVRIQTSWEDRYTILSAQKLPHDVIISKLGPRPTDEEAIDKVMSLERALASRRQ